MGAASLVAFDASRDAHVVDEGQRLVVIGNFDGVHRGHAHVLTLAVARARAEGLVPTVLTFFPHPALVLGRSAPAMLTSLARRAELMGALGVKVLLAQRFDAAFAAWSPEQFAETLLARTLRAAVVIVGENFRFGRGRAGDMAALRALGERLGFTAEAHALVGDARGPYSSTRAREAIRAGDMATARTVLGRDHSVEGVVVHGDARGRTIGFPTANLGHVEELLPADGVYAIRAEREGDAEAQPLGDGVVNVGVRPTVADGSARTVEAHLFDPPGDLYGARLRVSFVARLRGEQRFSGVDALKAQIAEDVRAAKTVLATTPLSGTPRSAAPLAANPLAANPLAANPLAANKDE
jgi:riboflavin kinase/FMN adenylyltransferase